MRVPSNSLERTCQQFFISQEASQVAYQDYAWYNLHNGPYIAYFNISEHMENWMLSLSISGAMVVSGLNFLGKMPMS